MYVCMMPTVACASFFGMHGMLLCATSSGYGPFQSEGVEEFEVALKWYLSVGKQRAAEAEMPAPLVGHGGLAGTVV